MDTRILLAKLFAELLTMDLLGLPHLIDFFLAFIAEPVTFRYELHI